MEISKPLNIHYFPIIKAFIYRPRNIGHKTQNGDKQNTTHKTIKKNNTTYSNKNHGVRRVWRYQRGNQNPYIEEEQTTQWPKEKVQKDKHKYLTKHGMLDKGYKLVLLHARHQ